MSEKADKVSRQAQKLSELQRACERWKLLHRAQRNRCLKREETMRKQSAMISKLQSELDKIKAASHV